MFFNASLCKEFSPGLLGCNFRCREGSWTLSLPLPVVVQGGHCCGMFLCPNSKAITVCVSPEVTAIEWVSAHPSKLPVERKHLLSTFPKLSHFYPPTPKTFGKTNVWNRGSVEEGCPRVQFQRLRGKESWLRVEETKYKMAILSKVEGTRSSISYQPLHST